MNFTGKGRRRKDSKWTSGVEWNTKMLPRGEWNDSCRDALCYVGDECECKEIYWWQEL